MVKIGPVSDQQFEFNQYLVPINELELNKIVKVCTENKYPFAVPILKEPLVGKTALRNEECLIKSVVFIFSEHKDDIIEKVELGEE